MLLVQRGLASTRSQAQRLITSGVHWQQGSLWKRVAKNGEDLPDTAVLRLHDDAQTRYVSRGGLKLEGALRQCALDVRGWRCLDIGQSTGGFTDCLLQHGALQVTGVDVGHSQLHPRLRSDPRVQCLEGINARHLDASVFIAAQAGHTGAAGVFDLVVLDISFISQTLVLPSLVALLAPGTPLLSLVKPQFELQPADIGKGGLVLDAQRHAQVELRLRGTCAKLGLQVLAWFDSAITGGDGNREFFLFARKTEVECI